MPHAGLSCPEGFIGESLTQRTRDRHMQALPFFRKKTLTGLAKTCG